jgi:hypothetical protein
MAGLTPGPCPGVRAAFPDARTPGDEPVAPPPAQPDPAVDALRQLIDAVTVVAERMLGVPEETDR